MRDLATMRAEAQEHERSMAAVSWLRAKDLIHRWHLCATTIRAIPASELPYLDVSRAPSREQRRYDPRDVAAYEKRRKVTGVTEGAA